MSNDMFQPGQVAASVRIEMLFKTTHYQDTKIQRRRGGKFKGGTLLWKAKEMILETVGGKELSGLNAKRRSGEGKSPARSVVVITPDR